MTETVFSGGDLAGTAGLEAAIAALGGALAVAAEPSGAGALALAYATPLAVMSIRNWAPFQEADGAWTALSGAFASVAGDLEKLAGEVDPCWKGSGSEAFQRFINTKVITPLESLHEFCQRAAAGCAGIAETLETLFWSWVGATVAAIVACIAADAAGPASPGMKWVIIGSWVTFVSGVLLSLAMVMQGTRGAASSLGVAMDEIKRGFKVEGDKVVGESAKIGKDQRDLILDPRNWHKEVPA